MGLDEHKISNITNQDLIRMLSGDKSVLQSIDDEHKVLNGKPKRKSTRKSKKFVSDFVNGGCSKKFDDSIF